MSSGKVPRTKGSSPCGSGPFLFFSSSLLVAVPALADDVYLVNGRKFEGVIAETAGSQVRIRMQGGVLSLPKDQVLRDRGG